MSKTKWIVLVVVLALLAGGYYMWKGNPMAPSSPADQSAAAANAPVANNNTNAMLTADAVVIDAQMQATAESVKGLDTTLTVASVNGAIAQQQMTLGLIGKLVAKIQGRVSSAGTMQASLQATLGDMNRNISNASSQVAAATKNVSKAPTPATLAQAKAQLNASQQYMVAVRANLQTLVQGLK